VSFQVTEAGIYDGLPMDAYIADPAPEPSLSKGVIATLNDKSPLHARAEHPRMGNLSDEGSGAADQGSAIHGLVCGGAERIVWVPFGDYRKDDAKEMRDTARATGRIPMLEKDRGRIEECAGRIAEEIVRRYGPVLFEQTLIWQEGGVWNRARPDMIAHQCEVIPDLKTATNAEPISWSRSSLAGSAYDIQAVHGVAGLHALTGKIYEFRFLVAEVEEPFGISEVALAAEYLDLAQRKRERAMRIWRKCLDSGVWPGYADGPHYASPPPSKVYEFENRVIASVL
jgi:hypothetical protein